MFECGRRSVPRKYAVILLYPGQAFKRCAQLLIISAGEIVSPDTFAEERVAGYHTVVKQVRAGAGRVSRKKDDLYDVTAEFDLISVVQQNIAGSAGRSVAVDCHKVSIRVA